MNYLSCLSCSSSAGLIGIFSSAASKEGVGLGDLPIFSAVELFFRECIPGKEDMQDTCSFGTSLVLVVATNRSNEAPRTC